MSINEQKHENRLRMVEDHIGRSLAESEKSGELRNASNYGKPLDLGDGYEETPIELRMGYKILKDAGYVPFEVELMRDIEALSRTMTESPEGDAKRAQLQRLAELRQQLAIRLERLKPTGA
jgi:hypothetical protein